LRRTRKEKKGQKSIVARAISFPKQEIRKIIRELEESETQRTRGNQVSFDPEEIEKMVMKEMRKIYSEKAIDHAMNPKNVGHLEESDGLAKITGSCGDTMEISLRIKDGNITDARFWTDGCGSSIACGSVITELIKGKPISEAEKIEYTTVLEALDGLPDSDVHCSVLASMTLKAAIESARTTL